MRTVLAVMLVASGCSFFQLPPQAPRPLTMADVAAGCRFDNVPDTNGVAMPFMTRVVCPFPAGQAAITASDVDLEAARYAAPLGVLLGREVVFVGVDPKPAQGTWSIVAYYSPGAPADAMANELGKMPNIRRFMAAQMLAPSDYAALVARADVLKEDRVYASCKSLVLDVAAAANEPGRAQSCVRALEVIDRTRSQRQANASSQEMIALERERAGIERQAVDDARRARVADAVSHFLHDRANPPPIEMPHFGGVRTSCTTYGHNTDCTTR